MSRVAIYLKAEHSPDLFHVQQELGRATSFPLKSQEKEFEKAVETAEKKLKKATVKYGQDSIEAQEAKGEYCLRKSGLATRAKRRTDVRNAKKGLGECYHPVNIETGELVSPKQVENQLNAHMNLIEEKSLEAELNKSSLKRVKKAKGMICAMVAYIQFFFMMLKESIEALNMSEEEEVFFREILIPLTYLQETMRKQPSKRRKKIKELINNLKKKAREGPWAEGSLEKRLEEAREIVRLFQRSSSCVEGRNGVLGLKHHGFHKISDRTLNALTVLHNYYVRREDGTTAAERFFGRKSDDLFESILETVPMLGRPRTRRSSRNFQRVAV